MNLRIKIQLLVCSLLLASCLNGQAQPQNNWISDGKAYSTDLEFSDQVAYFAGRQSKDELDALNELLIYINQDNKLQPEEEDLLLELLHLPDDKWLTYLYLSAPYAEIDPISEQSKQRITQFLFNTTF